MPLFKCCLLGGWDAGKPACQMLYESRGDAEIWQFAMEDFVRVTQRISDCVLQYVENGGSFNGQFDSESDAIFIKTVDGQILHANQAYNDIFCDQTVAVGRQGSSYLADSVSKIATHSDEMLMAGAMSVHFDHLGHDARGREVRLRTFKRTILGQGHPSMAILGIVRLLDVVGNTDAFRLQRLKDHWRLFSQLDDLDRSIAIGLAQGLAVGDLAEEKGVTRKTIENHRGSILRKMGLNAPIDLVKLVVRLQENGFGDFGV